MQVKTQLIKRLVADLTQPPYRGSAGLVLSLSGGVDSMVLADLFHATAHLHGSPLKAVHVHHGTGRFADCSQALVTEWCAERDIPLTTARFQGETGENFEYAAAAFRREVLAQACEPNQYILLAHHLQDQAETFFQALVRGAGVSSPVGMRAASDNRLRPFLGVDRALILDHAQRRKVPHVLDATNYAATQLRSTVRHTVMPALRSFHHGFEARLSDWLDTYACLQEQLEKEAADLFRANYREGLLSAEVWHHCKPYLRDFLLKHFWEIQGVAKPKRREQTYLNKTIRNNQNGSFDHMGRRCYIDLDGLILTEPVPQNPVVGAFETDLLWGPWSFRVTRTAEGRSRYPQNNLSLIPPRPLSKALREVQRIARIPYRYRENLPWFQFAGEAVSYIEIHLLQGRGLFTIHEEGHDLPSPLYEPLVAQVAKLKILS